MRLRRARGAAEDTPRAIAGGGGRWETRGVTGRGARSPEGDRGTGLCRTRRAWLGASQARGELNVRDGGVRRAWGGGRTTAIAPGYPPPTRNARAAAAQLAHPFLVGSERMHRKLESTRRLESKMNAI